MDTQTCSHKSTTTNPNFPISQKLYVNYTERVGKEKREGHEKRAKPSTYAVERQ